MKQEIKWVREVMTPMEAVKKWIVKNIEIQALHVFPKEKRALLRSGRNYDEGGYLVVDRIIDPCDGKEKTVFISYQITDIVAVEVTD